MDRTCSSCGFENPAGARFCGGCGQPLITCRSCGATVAPGIAFCTVCGADLSRPSAGVERKVVSVFFVDLVGFTGRAERLDPEDVRALLAPYYALARAELERSGGTVEKFIGDAVMGVFGAPAAHEDDPERAVRTGFAIRDAVDALNREDPGLDLHVRVGIATGEAVVDVDARPSLGEGIAHGDIVNTAARLQTAARVDGILVDQATQRATSLQVEYQAADPIAAKGKAEPVPVWEAVAPRARVGVDTRRRQTPLVGREAEVEALLEALARARAAPGPQLVTLVGIPGIGKSRLVWELSRRLEEEPDLVFWRQGRSLPYGEGVTFWALAEIVKAQAGILETDSGEQAAEKLRLVVDDLLGEPSEARWVEGHLRPLVGLAAEGELRGDRRNEAFAAWRRFFGALAERDPVVLIFEDLHWADEGLLDFILDHLVDRLTGVPLLVVATTRPELLERRPGWGAARNNVTTLPVSALSDEDTARLVAALLDQRLLPAELHAALLARAGGNPLYAEEYVRMLQDRGFLRRENGSWRLERADELPLPESVQAIIAARLDALPLEEKALIQDAAVVGRGFWLGALASIGGLPRWSVEDRLHALVRKQLIRSEPESAVATETQYAFLHVLIRDVAYGQIARPRRAEKHRLAGEWIESLTPDRSEDRAEMLAHHYLNALDFARASGQNTEVVAERARLALRDAGDRALGLNAFATSGRHYSAALELWPSDEPGRTELLFRLGKARFHAEGTGADVLAEARDELLAGGDLETAAEAMVLLGELLWMEGRSEPAFRHLEDAVALLENESPSQAKAYVLSNLSRFLMISDQNQEAIRVGFEALQMAEELGLEELRAHALDNIGVARTAIGDPGGVADLERSVAIAQEINSLESVRSLANLGTTLVGVGDLAKAFDAYERGRHAAESFGDADPIRWFESERVYESYWRGRWDEATRLADALIAEVEGGSPNAMELDCRLVRGRIRLGQGDEAGALEDAGTALDFARQASYPEVLFQALGFRARTLLATGRRDDADAVAAELLELMAAADAMLASFWVTDLAFALPPLGRGHQLAEALARTKMPSRWVEAAHAVLAGELMHAAALYAEIGSLPDEALARLSAGEALIEEGLRAEAEAELASALDFFRRVDAKGYVLRGEELLLTAA